MRRTYTIVHISTLTLRSVAFVFIHAHIHRLPSGMGQPPRRQIHLLILHYTTLILTHLSTDTSYVHTYICMLLLGMGQPPL